MLKKMRFYAEFVEPGIDIGVGIKLTGRDAAGRGSVTFFGARVRIEQGGENAVELWLIIIPLKNTALADGLPRMPGGDMRRRRGWELGGDLLDAAQLGEFNEKRMLFIFFIRTPAKTVDEEKEHAFVFFFLENIDNALRQMGEAAHVVAGFDEVWVHILFSVVQ